MSPDTNRIKYRPVLTARMIEHIIALAKQENPISSESIEVLGILAPFQAKIQNAALTPAYTSAPPKPSIEESLGMNQPATVPTSLYGVHSKKEVYWQACYSKYIINPLSCTVEEIQAAREHMYLHDKMSEEEKEKFEAAMTAP